MVNSYTDTDIGRIISMYNRDYSTPDINRLKAIKLLNDSQFLVSEDSRIVNDSEFDRFYGMDDETFMEMAVMYEIDTEGKTKIDIIREMIKTPLFEVITMDNNDAIYHGTHYKLIGNVPYAPGYFSRDILQSLGHIMRDFKELIGSYRTFNKAAIDKKIDDLVCIPSIYNYKFKDDTNLLVLKYPHINTTFSKLFIPTVLAKYVRNTDNNTEIVVKFQEKVISATQTDPKYFHGKSLEEIIGEYRNNCMFTCFGGWTNTPGYFLLQSIDYNSYFHEIGILDISTRVSGLYIPRDQDEIVLFGDIGTKINYLSRSYVLPYSYIDRDPQDSAQFIENFIRSIGEYKVTANVDSLLNISRYSFEYNIVRDETDNDIEREWNFSWFLTDLTNFNPYLTQEESGYNYKIPITDIIARFEHRLTYRSSKISLDDIDTLRPYLIKFIGAILIKWNSDNFNGVDELCRSIAPSNREYIPHL